MQARAVLVCALVDEIEPCLAFYREAQRVPVEGDGRLHVAGPEVHVVQATEHAARV